MLDKCWGVLGGTQRRLYSSSDDIKSSIFSCRGVESLRLVCPLTATWTRHRQLISPLLTTTSVSNETFSYDQGKRSQWHGRAASNKRHRVHSAANTVSNEAIILIQVLRNVQCVNIDYIFERVKSTMSEKYVFATMSNTLGKKTSKQKVSSQCVHVCINYTSRGHRHTYAYMCKLPEWWINYLHIIRTN